VRFPAKIHQVSFEESGTCDMQSIKFSGTLIWSIRRDNDGPLKVYSAFGDDICKEDPAKIKDALLVRAKEKLKNYFDKSSL
jgi:hypothetical protein